MSRAAPEGRIPDFLVIGAMKCGTTSLYHDLRQVPGLFLAEKELNALCQPAPAEVYQEAFRRARPDQLCGEVSPDYAKLPESANVVTRARMLCAGRTPRIVYLVREPVSRTRSHHTFVSSQLGRLNEGMGRQIDQAVRDFPRLIQYSRYAWQLRPWVSAFGRESLMVVRFEDYVSHRTETLAEILGFLGINPELTLRSPAIVRNPTEGRPLVTPGWRRCLDLPFYRRILRPLVSAEMRERFRNWLLPRSQGRPAAPSLETVDFILSQVAADAEELRRLLGLDQALWDLKEVRQQYLVSSP
ncbi:MAG: sulfotransferase [Verrucomicrobiales bacterium]